MTASQVLSLLAVRHSKDLFIPECKNGPTTVYGRSATLRKLDAWVLVKTWSPVTTIGYEIKVTRSDWLSDQKYGDYLPLCHQFYLVAPKGVVQLEELPANVGLVEASEKRLITRRRAAYRPIELPSDLIVYVLMTRVGVPKPETEPARLTLAEWVADKTARRELSQAVNEKTRTRFWELQHATQDAEAKAANLEHIQKRIEELGFDPNDSIHHWQVDGRLRDFVRTLTNVDPTSAIDDAVRGLTRAKTAIAEALRRAQGQVA